MGTGGAHFIGRLYQDTRASSCGVLGIYDSNAGEIFVSRDTTGQGTVKITAVLATCTATLAPYLFYPANVSGDPGATASASVSDNCTFRDATTGSQRSFGTTLTFSITDEHLIGSGSQLGTDDEGGNTCTFSLQYDFEMSRVPRRPADSALARPVSGSTAQGTTGVTIGLEALAGSPRIEFSYVT